MPFVKLDTGILDSTLWIERDVREVFITALLMAEPMELKEPTAQIEAGSLKETGFIVPPGWYGMVKAAGIGILNRAGVDKAPGMMALEILGSPEVESRSADFEGRRLVRVNGGFIVLNFMKYRDKDHTAAERQRRLRERKKSRVTDTELRVTDALPSRNITHSREQITDAELTPTPLPEQDPSMLAKIILDELSLSGTELSRNLTDVCRGELAKFRPAAELRAALVTSWLKYQACAAEGKLDGQFTKSAAKFFGEGAWANEATWPWKQGAAPQPKRAAAKPVEIDAPKLVPPPGMEVSRAS